MSGVRAINDQSAEPSPTAWQRAAKAVNGATRARLKMRHRLALGTFLAVVVAPLVASGLYLYLIAADQYASKVGFTVRSEEMSKASELLGGLSMLTQASSSDAEVLYEYIQSQTLVERIGAKLDLPQIFSRPAFDPVFAYDTEGTIEDLLDYWQQMVKISYASGSGLIEVEVRAFTPEDAQTIAKAVVAESTAMINEMSATARLDATRYAKEELGVALARLKTAREERTRFRSKTRIIDPQADIQGQMGLLGSLETQLAQAYIDLNLTLETSSGDDPRIMQSQRRIDVIKGLIEQERTKFGVGDSGTAKLSTEKDYPTLMGEFERLTVDVEYANSAYLAAMAALDNANAQADRQSRYLATYTKPSLPQAALYPERPVLLLMAGLFLGLIWAIGLLIFYSLRDRR